ncbi:insecticidal delta-endotoxin Cry8Ea1 family protein [Bacillus cereus]|nr:insecticidal delta-endotoxin Cry8Ea1 family protein [Bacillus cereus]MEB9571290.1 insecticidal delta-endotoxin Cry8Ea1 family protein [Bacillus cereus]
MNSYQNTNEYEILESSSNNTNMPNRYPFANDRDMSPMSWNDCQGTSWQDVWESSTSIAGIGIDLINFVAEPSLGGVNLLFSIIGKLIPPNRQSISALSICDLLSIIRKEVAESVLNAAIADFNGKLKNYREYYLSYLEAWLKDGKPLKKTNNSDIGKLVEYFELSEREFNEILGGSLARSNAQILLLPTFAQAANVQLLLLRDAVQYKEQWFPFLSAENVKSELKSPNSGCDFTGDYYERLKCKTAEYTNYCVYWYQAGLDQIKQAGTGADTWSKFNKFRREMTLAVLDIIAIFPTYDFEKYPLATDVELTREIYTDAVGYSSGTYSWLNYWTGAFNALEANGTRGPGLVTWLSSIGIYNEYVSRYFSGWVGTRHYEDYTKGNGTFQRMSGTTSNDLRNVTFSPFDIFKISSLAIMNLAGETNPRPEYRVSRTEFSSTSLPSKHLYDANNNGLSRMTIESTLPGIWNPKPSYTDYSHRLSNAACVVYGNSRVNVYGWTHTSMSKHNPIYPDKISQIPAVKAFALESGAYVSAGPGHTGGNVVWLPYLGRLKIRLTSAPTNKNYRVRVRYAGLYSGRLMVQRWSLSGSATGDFPYSSTGSNNTFGYVETLVTTFNQSGVEIIIQNQTSPQLIIDKIEFIPVDLTNLEYEGEQNLEKTKNAVNDLFIN